MGKEDVVITVCVIVLFLHSDVNKCDLYKVFICFFFQGVLIKKTGVY